METEEELNQILLSKRIDDFYVAIIENRKGLLTDEEYASIAKSEIDLYGESKKKASSLINTIKTDGVFKKYKDILLRVLYSFATVRRVGIITMIGNNIYDIGNLEFVDLRRKKIICFDNLSTFYNESNARLKYFTIKGYSQKKLLVDVDDLSPLKEYEKIHIKQDESYDLTSDFLNEARSKSSVLKRS